MSQTKTPAVRLPANSVKAILSAAGATGALTPKMVEGTRQYLSDAFARASRRAMAVPLTSGDVDNLKRAYTSFRDTIECLQDRDVPPPPIPRTESGETAWDQWLEDCDLYGSRVGRPKGCDWQLITSLLALYETVSGRRASGAQESGPTMRYLEAAVRILAEHAPTDRQKAFIAPSQGALRQQLPTLREFEFADEAWLLASHSVRRGDK